MGIKLFLLNIYAVSAMNRSIETNEIIPVSQGDWSSESHFTEQLQHSHKVPLCFFLSVNLHILKQSFCMMIS